MLVRSSSVPDPQRRSFAEVEWGLIVDENQLLIVCGVGSREVVPPGFGKMGGMISVLAVWVDYMIVLVGHNDVQIVTV